MASTNTQPAPPSNNPKLFQPYQTFASSFWSGVQIGGQDIGVQEPEKGEVSLIPPDQFMPAHAWSAELERGEYRTVLP